MKWIALALLCWLPAGYSAIFDLVERTDATRYCFNLSERIVSGHDMAIGSPQKAYRYCMDELIDNKKREYNHAYNDVITGITKTSDYSRNYNEFIQDSAETKKKFERYMNKECTAWALISRADRDEYQECMVTFYNKRIEFYKEYNH